MNWIQNWSQRYQEQKAARAARRRQALQLEKRIDQVTRDFSPIICSARGYRKRLREPVQNAFDYINNLVETIHGPIELSSRRWNRDPLLKAIFVDASALQGLLRSTADLKSFFRRHPTDVVFALLTTTRKEKTIFAAAMENGFIRRDVAQTAVEFTEHRIVAPAVTEAENRRELKHQALNILTRRALKEVVELQSWKKELTEQRQTLSAQLQMLKKSNVGLDDLLSGHERNFSKESEARQILEDIESKLKELSGKFSCPDDYLQCLIRHLAKPEKVLALETLSMRLNWMGVKLKPNAPEPGDPITLTEIDIKDRIKRVAILTTISARDIEKK